MRCFKGNSGEDHQHGDLVFEVWEEHRLESQLKSAEQTSAENAEAKQGVRFEEGSVQTPLRRRWTQDSWKLGK